MTDESRVDIMFLGAFTKDTIITPVGQRNVDGGASTTVPAPRRGWGCPLPRSRGWRAWIFPSFASWNPSAFGSGPG